MMRILLVACLIAAEVSVAQETVTRDANLNADVAPDGRLVVNNPV